MKKQNPILRVWELGRTERPGLVRATLSAFLGVIGGMVPYFASAQIIIHLLAGNRELDLYLKWLCVGLTGYAARTLLYNLALSMSHKATFSILKTIRQMVLAKLPRLPLGTVTDMSSGRMKQMIVDQVDSMETTLAHLFPELTANIAGPLLISTKTGYKLLREGKIVACKVGRSYRVPKLHVLAYLRVIGNSAGKDQ